jgi:hypothetical protein
MAGAMVRHRTQWLWALGIALGAILLLLLAQVSRTDEAYPSGEGRLAGSGLKGDALSLWMTIGICIRSVGWRW